MWMLSCLISLGESWFKSMTNNHIKIRPRQMPFNLCSFLILGYPRTLQVFFFISPHPETYLETSLWFKYIKNLVGFSTSGRVWRYYLFLWFYLEVFKTQDWWYQFFTCESLAASTLVVEETKTMQVSGKDSSKQL